MIASNLKEHLKATNCHWVSWEQFTTGEADVVVLVWSPYSKWRKFALKPWWKFFIRPVGYLLGKFALWLLAVASVLTVGRWSHSLFRSCKTHTLQEFLADEPKRKLWLMPVWRRGYINDTGKGISEVK